MKEKKEKKNQRKQKVEWREECCFTGVRRPTTRGVGGGGGAEGGGIRESGEEGWTRGWRMTQRDPHPPQIPSLMSYATDRDRGWGWG